jgi:hypothetical protein
MEPILGPSQTSRHATPLHSATPSASQIPQDYTHDNAKRDTQRRRAEPKAGPSPHARGPHCRHIVAGTLPRSSGCLLLVATPAHAAGEQLCRRRRAGHRDGVTRRCGTHGHGGRHRARPTASCGCRTRGPLGRAFPVSRWFTHGWLTHRPAVRSVAAASPRAASPETRKCNRAPTPARRARER